MSKLLELLNTLKGPANMKNYTTLTIRTKNNHAAIKSQHTPVFLYQITFMGKTKGALGIRETFSETSIGQDEEQAILNLYGMFDHITVQRVERI